MTPSTAVIIGHVFVAYAVYCYYIAIDAVLTDNTNPDGWGDSL